MNQQTDDHIECDLILNLETGLHARPAGVLAKLASQFQAKIELERNGQKKNAKSVMSLMSLGAKNGDALKLSATGADAKPAVERIQVLFQNGFHAESN